MTPPPPIPAIRTRARSDALEAAIDRLWPAIGISPDSAEADAIRDSLLAPAGSMLDRGGKRFRGHLVELCWQLGGGEGRCPAALPAVIEMIHAGSLIVDDIEDDSPERRGRPSVHRLFGMPLALNAGNWLYFQASELLRTLDVPAPVELALHHRLGRMLVQGHAGQALDLRADLARLGQDAVPERVATMSRLKTGSFMGLAAAVGATAAGAAQELVEAVERFGLALGDGLQMLDDLGNLVGRRDPAKRYEDLRHGRATWPWAWYAEVATPAEWRRAQAGLAAIRAGGPAAPLALDLMERVGLRGRKRVHRLLERAFADLRDETHASPLLAEVQAEIDRLEKSYV
jgi:geranylgeranyl pyrophosphate synthase